MKIEILIIALLISISAFSQDEDNKLQFNGFVDTYHAMRVKSPNDFMSSRTRFRGEVQKAFGKSSMFVSFNLNQNSILKDMNGFELREAYFDYTEKHWNLRAGRQLIIWGAADGMRITDLVSPMDMTEFLARDYDDIRMPVEALKFQYFTGVMKLELVYVPILKSFILPKNSKNPWSMQFPVVSNMTTILKEACKPAITIKNSEIGGRLSFTLPGMDFSASALHTWNKMPIIDKTISNDTLLLTPQYHRMSFLGVDFSKPLREFVIRGEAAFNFQKHFACKQPGIGSLARNTVNYLIGVDWYAPKEWMLSAQFSDETIFDYSNTLETDDHSLLMTFRVAKKLLNSTLDLSDFMYADLQHGSLFNRFSSDYSLSDQIHILAGYDHFHGDKGMFGMYKNNSEIWIKAKYSF